MNEAVVHATSLDADCLTDLVQQGGIERSTECTAIGERGGVVEMYAVLVVVEPVVARNVETLDGGRVVRELRDLLDEVGVGREVSETLFERQRPIEMCALDAGADLVGLGVRSAGLAIGTHVLALAALVAVGREHDARATRRAPFELAQARLAAWSWYRGRCIDRECECHEGR